MKFIRRGKSLTHRLLRMDPYGNYEAACGKYFQTISRCDLGPFQITRQAKRIHRCRLCERIEACTT